MAQVKSPLVPWDNTHNQESILREYPIFHKAYESVPTELLRWGILSPRFEEKTSISPQKFLNFIENDEGDADVHFINPCPINAAIYPNVLIHGEMFHKGISNLIIKVLSRMGYELDPMVFMDDNIFAFCNYFCGNRGFWYRYITFVDNFLKEVSNDITDKEMIYSNSANYSRDREIPYYSFVIERLFSVFLMLNRDVNVLAYKYTFEELKMKTNLPDNLLKQIIALTEMKNSAITKKEKQDYADYRNLTTTQYKLLFHME
jgi:hypothetical protein